MTSSLSLWHLILQGGGRPLLIAFLPLYLFALIKGDKTDRACVLTSRSHSETTEISLTRTSMSSLRSLVISTQRWSCVVSGWWGSRKPKALRSTCFASRTWSQSTDVGNR